MASLRSLGVSIRLGQATVWSAYSLPFLAYISSDQTLTSGLGAQQGASGRLMNSLLILILPANLSQRKACCVCGTESSAPPEETVELIRSSSSSAGYYRVHSKGGYTNGPRLNASYRIGCPRSPRLALSSRMSLNQ